MKNFSQSFKTFWADEDGATAIEYGLLASLIALAIITGATALGEKLDDLFSGAADLLVVP
jgi:pilus assembly protein Flp/PilA